MKNSKNVYLNDLGQWILFRGMCCAELERKGLTSDVLGCELWEYTEALDMSFEEVRALDLALWGSAIAKDVEALKRDIVIQH